MDQNRNEDKKIVRGILRGERVVLEKFYKREVRGLKRFIGARVGDRDDVDELAQDTLLSFLDSLPVFGFRSSLKTFLYSISRHEIADYFRRRYAKRALKYVPIVGELVAQELYSTEELSRRIDKIYRQLLPRYSKILQLKYEEGLSLKQIAGKLRLSVKAAESQLFRARKAFQLAYGELNF